MIISTIISALQQTNYLKVKVQPRSKKTEFSNILEDSEGNKIFKIRLQAIPEKGKANKELIRFLSKSLNIPKKNLKIISGTSDQVKLIKFLK